MTISLRTADLRPGDEIASPGGQPVWVRSVSAPNVFDEIRVEVDLDTSRNGSRWSAFYPSDKRFDVRRLP